MMEYDWSCGVCGCPNVSGTDTCSNCHSSAFLSSNEINERKGMLERGEAIDDRNDTSLKAAAIEVQLTLWAARVSQGESPVARKLGTGFWYFGLLITALCFIAALVEFTETAGQRFVTQALSLIPCYEVRNVLLGRTICFKGSHITAIRKNLVARWMVLLVGVIAWYVMLIHY